MQGNPGRASGQRLHADLETCGGQIFQFLLPCLPPDLDFVSHRCLVQDLPSGESQLNKESKVGICKSCWVSENSWARTASPKGLGCSIEP